LRAVLADTMENQKTFFKNALHEIQVTLDEGDFEMANQQWEAFFLEIQQTDSVENDEVED
jgi:hypothetical protein